MTELQIKLQNKLNSGFHISSIIKATGISRFWLKHIKEGTRDVPNYILIALDEYFKGFSV